MLTRPRFYFSLLYSRLNTFQGSYETVPDIKPLSVVQSKNLKIFFYVPVNNSGARVIVYDIYNDLISAIKSLNLEWEVTISDELPTSKTDYLICFKNTPKKTFPGDPKLIMLICDQAEIFWDDLPGFDYIVATSSTKFAKLLSLKNKNIFYISESETTQSLSYGLNNLKNNPSSRPPNLLWHGGAYSMDALIKLKPILESFASRNDVCLNLISGSNPVMTYSWGNLKVTHMPWSIENLLSCAKKSRLGFIPARSSLRTSYLKPASRVRCLFSLGVPTIGDSSVPDVKEFMCHFNGPVANKKDEWLYYIESLWSNLELNKLAVDGWATVNKKYSSLSTANQWINLVLKLETFK